MERHLLADPDTADRESDRPWRIMEMFARNAPLREVLSEVVELLAERYSVTRCAILSVQEGSLRCVASAGLSQPALDKLEAYPAEDPGALFELEGGSTFDGKPVAGRVEAVRSAAGEILGHVVAFADSDTNIPPAAMRLATRVTSIAFEQQHLVRDLLYRATHDSITLLPNRFLLDDRMQQAIAIANREGSSVALLHMDLDRFGTVNDLLGRATGDLLLEQAAHRIGTCLRATDTLARTGGDVFSIILPGATDDPEAVLRIAERIRMRLGGAPFEVAGHELTITVSIGFALYPSQAADVISLERCADAALFRAKHSGRNCVRGCVPEDSGTAQRKAQLESALGRALARSEFVVAYQPQIDLKSGRLSGAEALLRWHRPDLGLVSPTTFIPIAEETGLIVPIGRWVLREACRQMAAWRDQGKPVCLSVNLSAAQFAQDGYVSEVAEMLVDYRISPQNLQLELTESVLIGDEGQGLAKMHELKALGVSLAIDDFGTGYSTLSILQEIPLDAIKIDISFVRQIASTADRSPMVETIVSMARAMGKKTIAEGVETAEQQTYLAALGCDIGQGFLYGRPSSAVEFASQWLR